jgi:hypothetical protein
LIRFESCRSEDVQRSAQVKPFSVRRGRRLHGVSPTKRDEGGRTTQKSVGNAFLAVVRAEAKLCRAKFEATREAPGKDFKNRIWLESRSHRGSRQNVAAWCRIERSVAFFNLENASRHFDLFQAGGAETPRASERPLWCLADALRVT